MILTIELSDRLVEHELSDYYSLNTEEEPESGTHAAANGT
jgi:hypothetical protein